jgi:hypothetical protein
MDTPRTGAKWISDHFVGEIAAQSDEFARPARLGTTRRGRYAGTDLDRRSLEPSQGFTYLAPEPMLSRRGPGGHVLSGALKLPIVGGLWPESRAGKLDSPASEDRPPPLRREHSKLHPCTQSRRRLLRSCSAPPGLHPTPAFGAFADQEKPDLE